MAEVRIPTGPLLLPPMSLNTERLWDIVTGVWGVVRYGKVYPPTIAKAVADGQAAVRQAGGTPEDEERLRKEVLGLAAAHNKKMEKEAAEQWGKLWTWGGGTAIAAVLVFAAVLAWRK